MLVLNLIRRPLKLLLTQPLEFQQAAPPGFLAMQKGIVTLFGSGEYAVRLLPLVAGCVTMIVVYRLTLRLIGYWPAVLALAMTAFCKGLIEYSVQAKQYETDAALTVIILWTALPLLQKKVWSGSSLLTFALVTSLTGWFSHPATFAIVGAVASLGIASAFSSRWKNVGLLALVATPAAISLLTEYILLLRPLGQSAYLHQFWIGGFLPLPFQWGRSIRWFLNVLVEPLGSPGGYKVWGVAQAGFILGIVVLARHRVYGLILLLSPVLLAAFAAAIQCYPLVNRLALFSLPLLFIMIAVGVESLTRWPVPRFRFAAAGLFAAVLLLPSIVRAVQWTHQAPPLEEIKPVLNYVRDHRRAGDVVYVFRSTQPAFWYYQHRFGFDRANVVLGSEVDARSLNTDAAHLAGQRRVWIIVTHDNPDGHGSVTASLIRTCNTMGQKLDEVAGPDNTAHGYLYDLAKSAQHNDPAYSGISP